MPKQPKRFKIATNYAQSLTVVCCAVSIVALAQSIHLHRGTKEVKSPKGWQVRRRCISDN